MIPAFLVTGAKRLGIAILLNTVTRIIAKECTIQQNPEITYFYPKKKEIKIKDIIPLILYFVPIIGTIKLVLDFLFMSLLIVTYIAVKMTDFKKEIRKQKLNINMETPNEHLKELVNGEKMYKGIIDSLKMEGLSNQEINREIQIAQKENPYIRKNIKEEIIESQRRVENLQLLNEMRDYLLNPEKAYVFTSKKGRTIEYADVDVENDTLTIGVSKSKRDTDNPKILKRKFKLTTSEKKDY